MTQRIVTMKKGYEERIKGLESGDASHFYASSSTQENAGKEKEVERLKKELEKEKGEKVEIKKELEEYILVMRELEDVQKESDEIQQKMEKSIGKMKASHGIKDKLTVSHLKEMHRLLEILRKIDGDFWLSEERIKEYFNARNEKVFLIEEKVRFLEDKLKEKKLAHPLLASRVRHVSMDGKPEDIEDELARLLNDYSFRFSDSVGDLEARVRRSDQRIEEITRQLATYGVYLQPSGIREELHPLEDVVTAKVVSKRKHPNPNAPSTWEVVTIDYGGPRPVEVVCEGTQCEVGDFVPYIPVGKRHGKRVVKGKDMKGIISNGVILSTSEVNTDIPSSRAHGRPVYARQDALPVKDGRFVLSAVGSKVGQKFSDRP